MIYLSHIEVIQWTPVRTFSLHSLFSPVTRELHLVLILRIDASGKFGFIIGASHNIVPEDPASCLCSVLAVLICTLSGYGVNFAWS